MKTEFTTFCIKEGKEEVAEEWMNTLVQRKKECVETLTREKMVIESIFKFYKNGRLYLSWFSIQKDGHEDVETSDYEIDKLHIQYCNECIDRSIKREDHEHVVSFIPDQLGSVIDGIYEP